MDIYYDLTRQCRVDISGTRTTAKPKIRFREQPEWKIHFVDERNAAVGMGHVASWRAAVDRDFSSSTAPMCRTLDSSIDKSGAALGIVTVPINANTSSAKAAIDGQRSINAYFELWGLDASGNPAVYLEIDVAFEGVGTGKQKRDRGDRQRACGVVTLEHQHIRSAVSGRQGDRRDNGQRRR